MFTEFPAPAGINRRLTGPHHKTRGVPRASGDKPAIGCGYRFRGVSSPRQRG